MSLGRSIESAEPIPIALMGLGWVGMHRHAMAIRRSREFRLIGVIDRNEERAKSMGKALGVPHASQAESVQDVPWLSEAAAITISTPPHCHYSLVSGALARGLHVLTEKPFAMNLEEGEAMVEAAKRSNRTLGVTHNFQFSNSALKLKDDIESGRLGRLRRIHAVQLSNPRRRLPSWYESLPLGLFYDESPHLLYLIRSFSPGPLSLNDATVVPSGKSVNTPNLVQARYSCTTNDGLLPVTLDMHFEAPISEWHFSVLGEEAMGVVDVFRDIYLRLPNDGLHTTWTVLRSSLAVTGQHWLQHLTSGVRHLRGTLDYGNNEVYSRFAAAIRTGKPPHDIDSQAAMDILSMQHEIMKMGKRIND